ncbi:AMP-binding protein [Zobellia alginiliquefaciens]|uniref:AMP-binding protein n=1 Tax=Zobellia alginiliquefaciens TaxID=3032586 RepID=UPI0023E3B060|nr:AMP-binding protein [Zobellia alginiliquefaciens]
MQTYKNLHKHFKFNGNVYAKEELKEVAYSLVKEGEEYEKHIGDFLIDWLNEKSTITVHTSGSTGKPKPITLLKEHMVNSALATGAFFELQPMNNALLCLPATYIAGKMMLVRAMVLGLSIDCVTPSSYPLEEIDNLYDFVAMVPLQFENSLDKLNRVKKLIVGGAPISYKLKQQFLKGAQETKVYETYGMTETITHIAVKPLLNQSMDMDVFSTLSNVKIKMDRRGCLLIDAPSVSNGLIHTNDMVNLVSEDQFKWLGRYDNVINSGGVKLFPEHIETKLASVVESRFFVAGVPDDKLGQKLILIIEGNQDTLALQRKIEKVASLEKFEIPKKIYSVNRLEETTSGKIQRKATLDKIAF